MKALSTNWFSRYYSSVIIILLVIGFALLSWLFVSDRNQKIIDKEQTINFILSVAPKLVAEEDLIKLHSLINGRGALGSCLLGQNQQVLVRTTGSNCDVMTMDSYSLLHASRNVGTLLIKSGVKMQDRLPVYLLFSIMWTGLIIIFQINRNKNQQIKSVKFLCQLLDQKEEVQVSTTDLSFFSKELVPLLNAVKQSRNNLRIEVQFNIASQVAHDIRSPLSALEMISSQLGELPEDKRVIIRNSINRIRDIANSLVQQQKFETPFNNDLLSTNHKELQIELLMPVIDSLVSEKRLQFRDMVHVDIQFSQTEKSYGLFSKIDVNEFKRVLSNLINNSVEALPNQSGVVSVMLDFEGQFNAIKILDNGIGIPDEIIKKIGTRGATFNKLGGSGLGLHHAINTVESMGGNIKVTSHPSQGTTVCIQLPKVTSPKWFVPALTLPQNTVLVVFDDDQSIHQIWKGRIERLSDHDIEIVSFSSPTELRRYYRQHFLGLDQAVFLMDYEIINHKENGLDLIEQLGIQDQSILVTSRFEEKFVRERCESLGVRLIPKSMSGFVPINLV
jgi:signal transduction histidine kinase